MKKFYRCDHCGIIVGVVEEGGGTLICCGEPMRALEANTTDAAQEKHVPVVEVNGSLVTVTVGSVAHPMLEEHHIAWIALETDQGMQRKVLAPTGEPKAVFALTEGEKPVAAYEYCNLHGLWKKEL
ncbi:MAG TPA: desulfoferrodoxin [Firmicutes bacterium]|nr:desulfoferrodoxin [Bacillota bacterium]